MEIDEAIHMLKSYAGMSKKLVDNTGRPKLDQAIETVLKELEEIKEMLAHRIQYSNELEKDLFENASNYVVSKDKIKILKEKIHKELDTNGITRAYQILIDGYFEELLGE